MIRVVVDQEGPDVRPDAPAYRFLRLPRPFEASLDIPDEDWIAFQHDFVTQWRYRETRWQVRLREMQRQLAVIDRETWYARHYALLIEEPAQAAVA